MDWNVIDSGKQTPQTLMNKDAQLLEQLSENPILHLYEWEGNCATYGYFINPNHFFDIKAIQSQDINIARRPTGGGIIFHIADYAFSILIPASHAHFSLNTLENYAFVNKWVAQAMSNIIGSSKTELWTGKACVASNCSSFCMAKPTQYDIVVNGKKVGGAAQRRTRAGLLHQGSISLALPPKRLLEQVLINSDGIIKSMQENSFTFLDENWTHDELHSLRQEIKQKLKETLNSKR